ncbi:hypothetical protein D3869_09690 [Azospirillum brasilense]|uniref:Uncharacterized protein n=1 Tax=Azospirillum brasilense TaxID=192 RepID=A0A4D8QX09_AZOBR|nr:hypothetical protein D3869_09690 [Azospirillum brasilense]
MAVLRVERQAAEGGDPVGTGHPRHRYELVADRPGPHADGGRAAGVRRRCSSASAAGCRPSPVGARPRAVERGGRPGRAGAGRPGPPAVAPRQGPSGGGPVRSGGGRCGRLPSDRCQPGRRGSSALARLADGRWGATGGERRWGGQAAVTAAYPALPMRARSKGVVW